MNKKIYKSKCIFTSETAKPMEGAVVIEGDTILYAGELEGAKQYETDAEIIDVGNRTITPGFIDCHTHAYCGAKMSVLTSFQIPPDLKGEKAIEAVKKFVSETDIEKGEAYLVFDYDKVRVGMLSKYKLDEIFGREIPIVFEDTSLHGAAFSSKALELLGFHEGDAVPEGTKLEYEEDGSVGYITETLFFNLHNKLLLADEKKKPEKADDVIEFTEQYFNSNGITAVVDMLPTGRGTGEIWNEKRYLEREKEGSLNLRIGVCTDLLAPQEETKRRHEKLNGDFVFHCGVKGFADGGFIESTAWMSIPYEKGHSKGSCGRPVNDMQLYREQIKLANELGVPVRIHAEGDRAVSEVIAMYAECGKPDILNQIEHATSMTDDVIRQIKEHTKNYKLAINMQPAFLFNETASEDKFPVDCGIEFYNQTCQRTRCAINAGAMVSLCSSDFPATMPTISQHIRAAVNRMSDVEELEWYGKGYTPYEAVSLPEAIIAGTNHAAISIGKENCLGMLKKGFKADIAIFNQNLFEIDRSEYRDIAIYETIVDGKVVYQKEE